MKTASSFLVFVINLVAATSASNVPDFTEDALRALQNTDPKTVKHHNAELINAEVPVKFKIGGTPQTDGVTLFASSEPDQGKNDEICKGKAGIKIENGTTTCDVLYLRMIITSQTGVNSLQFVSFFGSSSDSDKHVVVKTPVFKIPSEHMAADKQQQWADSNSVGLIPSFDSKTLESLKNSEPIKLELNWLKKLLPYGLTNRQNVKSLDSFLSRPIAMPEGVLNKLVQMVDSMKQKDDSNEFFSFSNSNSE